MSPVRSVTYVSGPDPASNGGADGIRTHDLLDAIEARSQLRHGPTEPLKFSTGPWHWKLQAEDVNGCSDVLFPCFSLRLRRTRRRFGVSKIAEGTKGSRRPRSNQCLTATAGTIKSERYCSR